MLTSDPRTINLVALGMAKVTYGALKILRRHLGDDLDLGLIGFAVVLRTRRDLFQLVRLTSARLDRLELFVIENFWFMAVTKEQRVTRSQKTKDPSDKLVKGIRGKTCYAAMCFYYLLFFID